VKVSSFNIRFDNPSDGYNSWANRKEEVLNFLLIEKMDLMGLQEVLHSQIQYLDNGLEEYTRVGVGRNDGQIAGEYAPIYFKTERFEVLDSGNFWLSETPEVPSVGWDAVISRICSYAHLRDKISDQNISIYNTHFDHVGSTARLRSAELIRDSIQKKLNSNIRVILTGDLNTEPNSDPYNALEFLDDSYNSDLRLGPYGTYSGFDVGGNHNRRIDYILFEGFKSNFYETVSTVTDNRYLSDHFPIISELDYRSIENQ
jgi:endonuclease/exonuclease/phosphatase family metal-dependent hydrolase